MMASTLLDCLLLSLGHKIETKTSLSSQVSVQSDLNKIRGAKILLVEDNEVNQELAVELLTTNGLSVKVANNGKEALNFLEKEDFDGILMDCQMPVMDGYEATKKIRKKECYKDLPIIAMTANVMITDKEKVIAVGMDDHIAKPIKVSDMFSIMAKWIDPSNPVIEDDISDVKASKETDISTVDLSKKEFINLNGINTELGLSTCQGNHKLYQKLLNKFKVSEAGFIDQFKQALAKKDNPLTIHLAHSLKGVAGNIGAQEVYESAKQLEESCVQGKSLALIKSQLEQLDYSLSMVLNSLLILTEQTLETEKNSQNIDMSKLKILLKKLRLLLEEGDTDSTDIMDELLELPSISSNYKDDLHRLLKAIEEYEFMQALQLLDILEEKHEINREHE
jgi:CheY-like chemotaxis protein